MHRWVVEIWDRMPGELGQHGMVEKYAGESLLEAMLTMYHMRRRGVKIMALTFRGF